MDLCEMKHVKSTPLPTILAVTKSIAFQNWMKENGTPAMRND